MPRILLYRGDAQVEPWVHDFAAALPHFETVAWHEGERVAPCDYAVLWGPPAALLGQLAQVKAIFLMGAGADAILRFGDVLPQVPIVRLGDAGMGIQMAEYVAHAVLRYYRRFDEYEELAQRGQWRQLPQHAKDGFTVGVLGMGKLGMRVAETMLHFGFPVRGWSRTPKDVPGVQSFAGMDSLDEFLRGARVLVCLLPLTRETENLLEHRRLALLPRGAYLINVARGAHVDEAGLLALVEDGHIAGATLDVFRNEPLPAQHPFWSEPRITITPHISALTMREESVRQIAAKIVKLERGEPVDDVVDRNLGY